MVKIVSLQAKATKKVAHKARRRIWKTFNQLLPSFIKDMEGFINEMEEEEKK